MKNAKKLIGNVLEYLHEDKGLTYEELDRL